MKLPVSRINEDTIRKTLTAWVDAGGNRARMSPEAILTLIRQAIAGDRMADVQLKDGFRFGSKVGDSKLIFRIFQDGESVEIKINTNEAKELRKEAESMQEEFRQRLEAVLS